MRIQQLRRLVSGVALTLFAGSLTAATTKVEPEKPQVQVLEEIIAKVNGEIITKGDIDRARKQLLEDLKAKGLQGPQLEEELANQSKNLLRDKIDEMLLIQRAEELDIKVDSEVNKQLAEYQLRARIADPQEFADYIQKQTGMPFEDFKEQLKNSFLVRNVLMREVGSRITIPREEIEKYYNEHKEEFIREDKVFLREILISTEGKTAEQIQEAEKKAKEILERARRGERFEELARDHSDAVTAKDYGWLGGFKRGELAPQIEQAAFDKEKGYITDIIRVPTGFLILKVEDRHHAGLATLEEVENEIRNKLFMERFNQEMRKYLTELRLRAFLQIKDGYVDTGAAPGKDTRWVDPASLQPRTVAAEEVTKVKYRRRRLLWIIPIPFTKVAVQESSSKDR